MKSWKRELSWTQIRTYDDDFSLVAMISPYRAYK
jgi:hypothetical protein